MTIKFNARNIIFNGRPIVITKIVIPAKIVKTTVISTKYILQELFLFSTVMLTIFVSSSFSVHSSISGSINFFLTHTI